MTWETAKEHLRARIAALEADRDAALATIKEYDDEETVPVAVTDGYETLLRKSKERIAALEAERDEGFANRELQVKRHAEAAAKAIAERDAAQLSLSAARVSLDRARKDGAGLLSDLQEEVKRHVTVMKERDALRERAFEEAARVAEEWTSRFPCPEGSERTVRRRIAAAIRRLKTGGSHD